MSKFIIDESLPRSTAKALENIGHSVEDIRDYGLRGAKDKAIYEFAQKEKAIILTRDTDFGNILRYKIGEHFGLVVARLPNELSNAEVNRQITQELNKLTKDDFSGNLIIIEPGRVRIKKELKK